MEINKNKDEKIKNTSENKDEDNTLLSKSNDINTNKDTKQKMSKSKKKRMIKKEKYMSIKKMENINRQNILNSLEQHNKSNAKLASELISIKNLGQKRKREKQNNKEQNKDNNNNNEKNINKNEMNDNNEEMSMSSSSSDEEEITNTKENNNTANKPQSLINGMTPQEFLNKLLEEKRHQRELEELSEINQYLLGNNNLYIPSKNSSIVIERTPQIIEQRSKLPIISQEHDIMYSINNSLVTIICGETGSGKSTQIPQFLYEKGYTKEIGKIAITQPRRVAARSLAFRLREEMNMKQGLTIGYQVRYENENVGKNTEIKFVTDGILLKELENDSLLSEYSVIIIDEAHERTINSDLLIGFISQILKIRYIMWKRKMKYNYSKDNKKEEKSVLPLRLIIMSATLRVSEFSENKIFSGLLKPRIVEISSRQYPVHIYHSKKTENDYINEAFKYCCKIHSRLPEGNVIVFLTGKREILDLCKKLKDEFSGMNNIIENEPEIKNIDNYNIIEEKKDENDNKNDEIKTEEKKDEEKIVEEIDKNENNIVQEDKRNYSPVVVLPLYSSMEPDEQMKIYQEHKGKRMIVVSTNVAETSLTIPGVRYVIDSGRVKKRIYKSGLSFSTFKIEWISQASSNQRSGRAGRTCEGYCYRLYSNGLYVKMDKFTEPQISTSPLSQVILTLKSMKVKNIYSFPFITKPKLFFIDKSLEHLVNVGAVDIPDIENINKINRIMNMLKDNENIEKDEISEDFEQRKDSTTITEIGKLMAKFPVEPKLGKILIMANNFDLLEYAILIVAILSIENLIDFTSLNMSKKEYKEILKELNAYNNLSDILTYMSLVILILKGKNKKININSKKITELKNLSNQLISLCKYNFKKNIKKISEITLPSNNQEILLLQIILSSFIDNIARKRVLFDSVGNEIKINVSKSNKKDEQIIKKKIVYECNENNKECKIYNYSTISETLPEYLIYTEIISENNNNFLHLNKRWEINNIAVEMSSDEPKFYYYFARFLLEGEIIDELKKYKKMLNSNPNIITNKVSDMYIKVSKLIIALKGNKICCKEDLENKLKKDKNFLKDVLILWYDNPSIKKIIREKWPFLNYINK